MSATWSDRSITLPASTCAANSPPPHCWNRSGGLSDRRALGILVFCNSSFWTAVTLMVTFGCAAMKSLATLSQNPLSGSPVPLCHQVSVTGSPESVGAAVSLPGAADVSPPAEVSPPVEASTEVAADVSAAADVPAASPDDPHAPSRATSPATAPAATSRVMLRLPMFPPLESFDCSVEINCWPDGRVTYDTSSRTTQANVAQSKRGGCGTERIESTALGDCQ